MTARTIVTAPTTEPFKTDEAKSHLRVEISDDDTLIDNIIITVRKYVEDILNIALITQTWDYFIDRLPEVIKLPKTPLSSVTSISYIDTDGASQTVTSSIYTVDTDSEPGRIYLAYQQTWPTTRDIRHAITIRFVAGYGDRTTIPLPIMQAMLLLIGHLYENRESTSPLTIKEVPMAVDSLLASYRMF